MSLPKLSEKRQTQRRRVRRLPGWLTVAQDNLSIANIPVDVSMTGLGILTSENLAVGTELTLHLDTGETIALELKWKLPEWNVVDLGGYDEATTGRVYRCGLQATNPELNLEQVFYRLRCIL